ERRLRDGGVGARAGRGDGERLQPLGARGVRGTVGRQARRLLRGRGKRDDERRENERGTNGHDEPPGGGPSTGVHPSAPVSHGSVTDLAPTDPLATPYAGTNRIRFYGTLSAARTVRAAPRSSTSMVRRWHRRW